MIRPHGVGGGNSAPLSFSSALGEWCKPGVFGGDGLGGPALRTQGWPNGEPSAGGPWEEVEGGGGPTRGANPRG